MQSVWAEEVLENPFYLLVAPPRMGKTRLIEMICLYQAATNPREDGRTWARKESQAANSLAYQREAIERSQILWNYLALQKGKRVLSSMRYRFVNGSDWKVFGIMSEFEGENASIIRLEEFDDLDIIRVDERVLPRGSAANENGQPTRIYVTGTIQEAKGNMYQYDVHDNTYRVGTKFNVDVGLRLGYYDEAIIGKALETLTKEAYERIYLLKYVSGRNFIWEERLDACQRRAATLKYEGVEFQPGGKYQPMGHVFCGMDMGHSGTSSTASVYSLQVFEQIGDQVLWLNGCIWPSTTEPEVLIRDVTEWWYYYKIEGGYADALKASLVSMMNDRLYDERLISVDRQKFPENAAGNWNQWSFSPRWNTGQAKWAWASTLRNKIDRQKLIVPRFDAKDDRQIALAGRRLKENLLNVRENNDTHGKYPKLEPINPKLGDDDFDAATMALGCINDRAPGVVDLTALGSGGNSRKMVSEFGVDRGRTRW
ncbi:hypothetical protein KAH55_13145 [bacterium]|nr:hypothetical protein [bacterium]